MTSLRLKRVNGKSEQISALLKYLQLSTLPGDEPIGSDKGYWWIALTGELPVAFAGLYVSQQDPLAGYLCRAGVLPSHRGLGLQSRLLRVREQKARKLGMTSLVTDTFDNPHSSNNLISSGFKLVIPPVRYGAAGTNYWRKPLQPK